MRHVVALISLLAPLAGARANITPGLRTVPVAHTFTIDRVYPEWEFWLVSQASPPTPVDRLPLTPSNPVRVPSEGLSSPYHFANLYAVPKRLLEPFANRPPPSDWFHSQRAQGVVELGHVRALDWVMFADSREQIEVTHRIEMEADNGRLVEVARNRRDPIYYWTRVVPCCLVPPLGILAFGFWVVRRALRRPR